jgi:hypothetical protein
VLGAALAAVIARYVINTPDVEKTVPTKNTGRRQ